MGDLMKVVFSENKISIFMPKIISNADINDYIKKLIIKLKHNYKVDIFGFYKVNVYKNQRIGMIIDLIMEEEIDFFKDLLDLKIEVKEDSEIYLKFDDYFLNNNKNIYHFKDNYYISIDNLSDSDFLSMIEFSKPVYGEDLTSVKNKFKLIINN